MSLGKKQPACEQPAHFGSAQSPKDPWTRITGGLSEVTTSWPRLQDKTFFAVLHPSIGFAPKGAK